MRAVLDTNVLFSAFVWPGSIPAQVVDCWRRREFTLCLSPAIVEELAEVLARPRVRKARRFMDSQANAYLALLRGHSSLVEPVVLNASIVPTDPDDDVIVATAMAAEADLIVSGDSDLRTLVEYRGIRIVSPREFLDLLGARGG